MHTERRYGGLKLNVSHSAKIPRRNEGLNQMRMDLWLTSIPAQPTQPLHQTSHPKIPTGVDFGLSFNKQGIRRWDCCGVGGLMTLSLPTLVNAASASCDHQCCPCWSQGWGPAVAWAESSPNTHSHTCKKCTNTHATQQTNRDRDIIQLKWLCCAWVTHMLVLKLANTTQVTGYSQHAIVLCLQQRTA